MSSTKADEEGSQITESPFPPQLAKPQKTLVQGANFKKTTQSKELQQLMFLCRLATAKDTALMEKCDLNLANQNEIGDITMNQS